MEEEEDRISQLPEHILEHVISRLPQHDAVGTCILSKSWRHLGPTRPKLMFDERSFRGSREKFLSIVENTFQRYHVKNLPIQEFILSMWHIYGSNHSNSNLILNKWIVKLQTLKRLSLHFVWIEDETLEKIMSSCPSIQHLVLDSCQGLSSVVIDDAPSLETIRVSHCSYFNKNNNFFPRLKSLCLWNVHLTTESFDNLSSNNFPCLEELELHGCSGFTEFKLSSRSIKRLIIYISHSNPIEAIIDAANMLYFQFTGLCLPTISFKTTTREWKSHIKVCHSSFSLEHVSSSTWSLKLHEFLKALSPSQISLHISYLKLTYHDTNNDGGSCEPVVVEHLCLREYYQSSQLRLLLNCVFRICRPRYIGLSLNSYSQKLLESQLAESIWKILINEGGMTKCNFWQQDLEGSSIQVSDKNTNEWHSVQIREFSNNQSIRFRLKWKRDLS